MSPPFTGPAAPLTSEGIERAAALIDVSPATLWCVVAVETRGVGFMPDCKPYMLFGRNILDRRTDGRFDATSPDISGLLGVSRAGLPDLTIRTTSFCCPMQGKTLTESTAFGAPGPALQ